MNNPSPFSLHYKQFITPTHGSTTPDDITIEHKTQTIEHQSSKEERPVNIYESLFDN